MLGLNYLSDLGGKYSNLANLGMGAASQGAVGAQNLGAQTANLLGQQGQAIASGQLARGNLYGQALGQLGGFGYNYLNQQPVSGTYSDGSLI